LAAIHVINTNVSINNIIEIPNCIYGTPNGILIIMAIGEVNGIIDNHNVKPLSGFSIIAGEHIIAKINGMVNIVMN
jgi:hypothetical protein